MKLRIKEVCQMRSTTQKELAENLGVSEVTLSRASNGNTSLPLLEKIAVTLDVPISALFEAEKDFIAFVRRNGETFTFDSEQALKEYAATLPMEDK